MQLEMLYTFFFLESKKKKLSLPIKLRANYPYSWVYSRGERSELFPSEIVHMLLNFNVFYFTLQSCYELFNNYFGQVKPFYFSTF